MLRKQIREELLRLAESGDWPQKVVDKDSDGQSFTLQTGTDGDLVFSIGNRAIRFVGAGGGDNRPLTKEVLRMFAIALEAEQRPGRSPS